jgi:ubiquitin carboxyl-terminal hydrolase 34
VKDTAKTEEDIFPMRKPYKLLYSVQALSACLREESLEVCPPLRSLSIMPANCQKSEPNEAFISHSVRILVAALIRPQMQTISDNDLKLVFAYRLVECLLSALLGMQGILKR